MRLAFFILVLFAFLESNAWIFGSNDETTKTDVADDKMETNLTDTVEEREPESTTEYETTAEGKCNSISSRMWFA